MKKPAGALVLFLTVLIGTVAWSSRGAVVFESTSVYHHIKVIDQGGIRTLSFDGSMETRMSLRNPLQGHFQYTEMFHLPWIWNPRMTNVLMIGLGGGSTQRSYNHYYTNVHIDTVELDPKVVDIAKRFFGVKESDRHDIHTGDGRVYLRRNRTKYDAIIMDAYQKNRYGSFIPYHLATEEFFEMAKEDMTEDGVLAYNVIGSIGGDRADIIGSMYKTLNKVFPQVYLFPARDSRNVVLIATMMETRFTPRMLNERANQLIRSGQVQLPEFRNHVRNLTEVSSAKLRQSPLLTDDYAPVDGLLRGTQ